MVEGGQHKAVTMAHVGVAAGVSDRTVSNVLSGKVPVSPATREAVMKAVQELGYRINTSARGLKTGRTGSITLAVPDLSIDYFVELTQAVMREAESMGWSVTLQQTETIRERELSVVSGVNHQPGDGLIFQPHALGQDDIAALQPDRPMVLLGERIFEAPFDHVTMANTDAAAAATRHLLQTGRRRIAVIGPNLQDTTATAATLRLQGYRQALEAAGVPFRSELIGEADPWRQAQGAAAVEALIARGVTFDGLFCFNDTLAFGAMHALHRNALAVPSDVAVVGFDNTTASAFCVPSLTTVEAGVADIASNAVRLLAQRSVANMRGPSQVPAQVPPQVHVAGYSIVRRSSA